MRRTSLMLLVSLLILVLIPAQAAQTDDALVSPLEIVPADMHITMLIETGDDARASLDSIIQRVAGWGTALGMPQSDIPTVNEFLTSAPIGPNGQSNIAAWLGDYAVYATGLEQSTIPTAPMNLAAVHVRNRTAAEVTLADWGFRPDGEGSGWAYYRARVTGIYVLLRDDLLLYVTHYNEAEITRLKSGDYPRLATDARFLAALDSLPDSGYGSLIYFSGAGQEGSVTNGEPIIAGGRLIDDETFLLDVAVNAPDRPDSSPLNPAFAAHIPADATAIIHVNNLAATIAEVMTHARAATEDNASAQRDFTQAMQGLSMVGLNPDTLQTWTDGDLALFARLHTPALIDMVASGDFTGIEEALQFGIIIETSDPTASTRLARNLISLIRAGLQNARTSSVTSADETIADTTVTVLTIVPDTTRPDLSLRIAAAANEDIFAFGTHNAVQAALTRTGGFADSALTQETASYLLPDASAVWRLDGANFGSMIAGYMTYAAVPANVVLFSEITSPDGTVTRTESPPTPIAPPANQEDIMRKALNAAQGFIQHATISTVTRDGAILLRATFTLGE